MDYEKLWGVPGEVIEVAVQARAKNGLSSKDISVMDAVLALCQLHDRAASAHTALFNTGAYFGASRAHEEMISAKKSLTTFFDNFPDRSIKGLSIVSYGDTWIKTDAPSTFPYREGIWVNPGIVAGWDGTHKLNLYLHNGARIVTIRNQRLDALTILERGE